ncbi:hypothetical protein BgAZ_300380 [Babesia gibsoni]|uniref:PH domain-containing protein n=1 Tax=Babesia gibsoni TaxID=33632 RepID=A0AAD8LH18_BABGI|nr:hypothetical protein BgAZ_300380 [Babesia gibsoni]
MHLSLVYLAATVALGFVRRGGPQLCVQAFTLPSNSSPLGSAATVPKESDIAHIEDEEINESEAIHNLDDEVRNHEILDLGRSEDFYLANHGSKCDVLMDDLIDVALEPRDMLKTQQFVGSITPAELRLYFKQRANGTEKGYKMGKLFARFSLSSIVTPLETVRSSRDCFRLFYKREPVLFCAEDTNHRDYWMHAILKAKFCHTAHTTLSKAAAPEKGLGSAELPDLSNKSQRLADLLNPKKGKGNVGVGKGNESNITNIDIKSVGTGEPQIFLDGEEVKPEVKVQEQTDLIKQQAERARTSVL